MGVKSDCYDGSYQEPDYNQNWQWTQDRRKFEFKTVDTNILAMRQELASPPDDAQAWLSQPIDKVCRATWDFQARLTSNAGSNDQDHIWFGQVETTTQTMALWGFKTWREWRDHLAPQDRPRARTVREEMLADLALAWNQTGLEIRHWVAKESNITAPGFWAITAGWPDTDRYFWIYYNQQELVCSRRRTKTSTINLAAIKDTNG